MVKICGLTRLEDVLLARDLGAWALGFVFAPSPRRLAPATARQLIREAAAWMPGGSVAPGASGFPLTVGVFGDVPAREIAEVADEVGLDCVQLHGTENPSGNAVRAALAGRDRPVLVIQAVPVVPEETSPAALKQAVATARGQADIVLLDTKAPGRFGGSGTAFSWPLAREAGEGTVLLIAGGIGPDNVRTALRESSAWGVDVSSGVEHSPGIKDVALMSRLFTEAGVTPRAASAARTCPTEDNPQGGADR